MDISVLQKARYQYKPKLPTTLGRDLAAIAIERGGPTEAVDDRAELKELFSHTYGRPIVRCNIGFLVELLTHPGHVCLPNLSP